MEKVLTFLLAVGVLAGMLIFTEVCIVLIIAEPVAGSWWDNGCCIVSEKILAGGLTYLCVKLWIKILK